MITDRVVGEINGDKAGPTAVFIGGIHGNEPAGVLAIERVFDKIYEQSIPIHGNIVGLAGNLSALKEGQRYLDKDLNRIWFTDLNNHIENDQNLEEINQKNDLLQQFKRVINNTNAPTYFFDLHTTSSQSVPFISISDTIRNRDLVEEMDTPIVLGLEEKMEGTLFSYFSEIGIPMVLYEGGQHEELSSVDNIESFIWMMLCKIGLIEKEKLANYQRYRERIAKENVFRKSIFQLKYRLHLNKKHEFQMNPGFVNFQEVKKGDTVAVLDSKEVKIPFTSRIFMPLYQSKGSDGFFLIKSIDTFWLNLSKSVRKLGLDKYMSLLPGIRKHKEYPNTFIISRFVAESQVMNLFHLLGYRRIIRFDEKFIVSRRPYDWVAPDSETVKRNFNKLVKPEGMVTA